MKNSLQSNPVILKIAILVTCFMVVMIYNESKAATRVPTSAASHLFK